MKPNAHFTSFLGEDVNGGMPSGHNPVLLSETLHYLNPQPGGRFIDATFGRGGHARAILNAIGSTGFLWAMDQDPSAIEYGQRHFVNHANCSLIHTNFMQMGLHEALPKFEKGQWVDGILFDLGVSSPQIDHAQRGFSFQVEGPLDMRMNPNIPTTAADLVNQLSVDELKQIFQEFGEERFSGKIAQAIVGARHNKPIATTTTLANIIRHAVPRGNPEDQQASVIRIFQALRIAVNEELSALQKAIGMAGMLLKPGGRLVIISFHSLEDRIVKQFFQQEAKGCLCPPTFPQCVCGKLPTLKILTRKPVSASPEECVKNSRARSARLRAAERC